MARVRRGAFTCVGWQVTLRDPIWQVTSRSSETWGSHEELYRPLPLSFTRTIYILFNVIILLELLQPGQISEMQTFTNCCSDNFYRLDAIPIGPCSTNYSVKARKSTTPCLKKTVPVLFFE